MHTNTKNKSNRNTIRCSSCGYPLSKTLSRCSFCGKEFDPSIFDIKEDDKIEQPKDNLEQETNIVPKDEQKAPQENAVQEEPKVNEPKEKVTPLTCKCCGKHEFKFVSEYVELEEKPHCGVVFFLDVTATILLAVMVVTLLLALDSCINQSVSFLSIPTGIVSLVLLGICVAFYITASLIKALTPYKHETHLLAVCSYCGNAVRINEKTNVEKINYIQ